MRLARLKKVWRIAVLIVPLWNWNASVFLLLYEKHCSNRTFMELKYLCLDWLLQALQVLIVPLWNWNTFSPSSWILTSRPSCTSGCVLSPPDTWRIYDGCNARRCSSRWVRQRSTPWWNWLMAQRDSIASRALRQWLAKHKKGSA